VKFDEQIVRLKDEIREKESSHESIFNEMDIPAAVLDERGIIAESNQAMSRLFPAGARPVGQPFSSLMEEEARRDFIGYFMNAVPGRSATTSVSISGRQFRAHLLTRESAAGQRGISAIFLFDETSEIELKSELGRTIDTLRSEKESARSAATAANKYSEDIVRTSAVPTLVVRDGVIRLASESASEIFGLQEGAGFDQFLAAVGFSFQLDEDAVSEVTDSHGKIYSVARWKIGDDIYVVFDDISEFRRAEEELRRSVAESETLFNSFLPVAAVTAGRITKWNDMFESLFKEFLSGDGSFDGFLRYLGEPPEAFKSELAAGSVVMRTCRTTDRKSLNVSASQLEKTVYLFVEDITEPENLKQQLRAAQGLLSSLLESFSEEPVFVVEGGIVRAANVAARQKLSLRLDERAEPAKILATIGIVRSDDTGELNGQFYKVENTTIGSTQVYRFRLFNQEVAQRPNSRAEAETGYSQELEFRRQVRRNTSAARRAPEERQHSSGENIQCRCAPRIKEHSGRLACNDRHRKSRAGAVLECNRERLDLGKARRGAVRHRTSRYDFHECNIGRKLDPSDPVCGGRGFPCFRIDSSSADRSSAEVHR